MTRDTCGRVAPTPRGVVSGVTRPRSASREVPCLRSGGGRGGGFPAPVPAVSGLRSPRGTRLNTLKCRVKSTVVAVDFSVAPRAREARRPSCECEVVSLFPVGRIHPGLSGSVNRTKKL